ncbi:hypothetical protein WJX74_000264 [Apatococcus lobatus]|uniref:DEUBAD domain-containing protein n=1 Tax=Apatococcus lobatus TaxID=904363 RepID=A0AAW1Q360_9CHLO
MSLHTEQSPLKQAGQEHAEIPENVMKDITQPYVPEAALDGPAFDELILHDLCGLSAGPRDPEDLQELLNSFPALLDPSNAELRQHCLGPDAARVEQLVSQMAVSSLPTKSSSSTS